MSKENIAGMSPAESIQIHRMLKKLREAYVPKNLANQRFYKGNEKLKDLGISLPEPINSLTIGTPWIGTAIDSLNAKIKMTGFSGKNEEVASRISADNQLPLKAHSAHLDALIFGTCYLQAGAGDESRGEPKVIVTAESPLTAYGEANPITRSIDHFIKIYEKNEKSVEVLYMNSAKLIHLSIEVDSRYEASTLWGAVLSCKSMREERKLSIEVLSSKDNTLGFVPVVKMLNRPDSSLTEGATEITKAMKQISADAIRAHASIVSMRESFSIPRGFLLSYYAADDNYDTKNYDPYTENIPSGGYDIPDSLEPGGITAVSPTPIGDGKYITPELKQLEPGEVDGYIKQLEWYASLMSGATSLPTSMLGGPVTSNPPSAESLAASLSMLSEKAAIRSKSFGLAWSQIMSIALKLYGVEDVEHLRVRWGSPSQSVVSSAAQADAITKLVAAGVFSPTSRYVYEYLGVPDEEIDTLIANAPVVEVQQIEKINASPSPNDMPPIAIDPQVDSTLEKAEEYAKYVGKYIGLE